MLVVDAVLQPPVAGRASRRHFRAVAAATDLPVMLYDIPIRTGRKIATDVLLRLAREVPNIVGREGRRRRPRPRRPELVAEAPDGFELYSGDDTLTLPLLAVGAVGVGRRGHATGRRAQIGEMVAAFEQGRRRPRPRRSTPGCSSRTRSRPAT